MHAYDDRRETENPDELLVTAQAARLLDISPRTLEGFRCRGGGPPFIRISSRAIRYRRGDLYQWLYDRRRTSTSE